jgi:Protein of unknown function (DUF3017)
VDEAMLTERDERPEAGSTLVTSAPATAPATETATETEAGVGGTAEGHAVPVTPAMTPARAKASVPRWAHLPYGIVFAGTAGGLFWTGQGPRHVVTGMLTVASAVLVAAVLRLVLPERRAGLLLSRRRLLDVVVLAILGASIMAVVLVLPSPR